MRNWPRVTVPGLMTAVVLLALAFVALRTASEFWYGTTYTFTVVMLLWSVIASRFGRPGSRAFWYGFAVFGWGLLLLGGSAWAGPFRHDELDAGLNRNLLTSKLILFLVPRLRKETDDLEAVESITANTVGIAHLLICLAAALGGGIIAAWLRRRRPGSGARRPSRIVGGAVIVSSTVALGVASAWSDGVERPSASFFPPDALREDGTGLSRFQVEWYSKQLAAMGEPPLWPLARPGTDVIVYRLLWLPSFHHPVCVRVDFEGRGAKLRARVLDGYGGYEPGRPAIDREVALTDDQWRELDRLVAEAEFWKIPISKPEDGGNDGDQLIVEGVNGSAYHVVDRWEPDAAYEKLCHFMLSLTGLKFQNAWKANHAASAPEGTDTTAQ